jgi:glycine/D-amino acid oxidase-like deaminating enzyme/nitrite reductase/ring-hydroxylating ferredoxin subunit
MKRDGECISLWQHQMPVYVTKDDDLNGEIDVVIVGGGITGISTALRLQQSGKKCIVVEAQNIGFGTTGGTTCHLNTLMETPYYQIQKDFGEKSAHLIAVLAHNSIDLIKKNIKENSIDCQYQNKSAYLFAQDEEQAEELNKIISSAKKMGVRADFTESLPAPFVFNKVAKIEDQGQMHASQYLYGIAEAFEKTGGKIVQHCKVTEVSTYENETFVTTTRGRIKTKFVVYATHIPPGINMLHLLCAPYRSYVLAVKLIRNDQYPESLIYDMEDPYHYYRTQEVDGVKYLIAGGEDHKTGHEENTNHCFKKLESYVRNHYMVDSIEFQWSSQYFESADGLPYIGHLPGNPKNVFVATGFGGNGIIYGTASAIILTDLICNGYSEYKDLLDPDRIKSVVGFASVIKEATNEAGSQIERRFEIEKIQGVVELAKGEAKIVKYESNSVGIYKDENGKLFAVNPSCSHIKCTIGWNNAEKSWDCPCHGSRFSYTGELLTAPARKDLEIIDLIEKEDKIYI